jgi:hypothetical protein
MRAHLALRSVIVGAALAIALSVGVPAALATSLSTAGTPDYAAGTVPLVVTADAGVTSVTFEYRPSSGTSQTVAGVEGPADAFGYDLALKQTTTVVARAFVDGNLVWSGSAVLSPSGLAPGRPVLSLKSNQLVRGDVHLTGTRASRAVTMAVQSRKSGGWKNEWTGPVTVESNGSFQLPNATMPNGSFSVRVIARSAFGSAASASVHVWNLGAVHAYSHLVLVDKSSRHVYVIVNGRVTFNCRCAIGMPWVPTPTGTFKLGKRHRTPNAVWGPWRLNLRRRRTSNSGAVSYSATKYYIHGTNDPSSIGHMRSHGCVRLLNKNIRKLSTVIDGYMAVIRE